VTTRGQALVLHGEPGIGKSRLLAEAAAEARERGMTVLTTTGVQTEAHLPFAGLHQLLRPVRDRARVLPDLQRAALEAAFGLADEAAPEHSGSRWPCSTWSPRSPATRRCCSSPRTRTGSTARPRTCSPSSRGASNPIRSSLSPPRATATRRG
jgi:hypothetical protein